jgi:Rps23 Pro-64 3,4-dihydroxylase Tpa1-like proline 4-hydroxylase
MPLLNYVDTGGYRQLDETQCRAAGRLLADEYRSATPFPHVVIDDFIDDAVLRAIVRDFPRPAGHTLFTRNQERLKYQYHPQDCSGLPTRNLFAELNSQAFLGFLAEMTGISGLIADAYYTGAGLHETVPPGHLGIHADFNRHERMGVERRLNLLIYLNDDWDTSYGGALELWDRAMTGCVTRVSPILGRAVIFTTDLDSFHGHPDPLACPEGRSRRSIATYYYAVPAATQFTIERTTNFRRRPGSSDQRDWKVLFHHLAQDWTPPIFRRGRRRARPPLPPR